MIYLFHGSDVAKTRAKAFAWVAAARVKAPEAPYTRLEASQITAEAIAEVVGSQGLFFSKTLVLLDDPFSENTAGELVLEHLDMFFTSTNIVAILAPKLLTPRVNKIEAKAEKVFRCDVTEKKSTRGFNSALVNALAHKDGAMLWKELVVAYRQGDAPEMIHGLLHWKARDLMHKGARGWTKEEARILSRRLIELLSESRGGSLPLSESLERFALSLAVSHA